MLIKIVIIKFKILIVVNLKFKIILLFVFIDNFGINFIVVIINKVNKLII